MSSERMEVEFEQLVEECEERENSAKKLKQSIKSATEEW